MLTMSKRWPKEIIDANGFCAFPNMLFDFYTELELTPSELQILLLLIRFKRRSNIVTTTLNYIAGVFGKTRRSIRQNVESLENKGLIRRLSYCEYSEIDLSPLIKTLQELKDREAKNQETQEKDTKRYPIENSEDMVICWQKD